MKAAYDPRIRGIHLKIGSVSAGWAKLQVKSAHLKILHLLFSSTVILLFISV